MKVKAKKNSELPPNVKAVVDRVINAPYEQLPNLLRGFSWVFGKVIYPFAELSRPCG